MDNDATQNLMQCCTRDKITLHFSPTAEFGLFDEILSVCKQNVKCASVHLFSSVQFQCALYFLVYKLI